MRALAAILGGLGLGVIACTQQIELFPDQAPPDSAYADAAAAEGGQGCVAALDPEGTLIQCACRLPCVTDSDCPKQPDASGARCDAATGLCAAHGGPCKTRADCRATTDPSRGGWLCISSK